ncbi:TlpA disulfide reductase family protein [Tautonia sp. JC769]|uniref:TlpA family protein disulfide reductase n=1 Tax=Tautonia sp. JC769 TaxID=3232135 RepID=UPI00345923EA
MNVLAGRACLVLLCCLLVAPATRAEAPDDPVVGLPDGWTREIEVPAVKDDAGVTILAGATLGLSVEQGWLIAKRETTAGAVEWRVVLARASDARPPSVELDRRLGGLRLGYRGYFVRDSLGALRILREPKSADSPPWPAWSPGPKDKDLGSVSAGVCLAAQESGDWCWVSCGPAEAPGDVWLRLEHKELQGNGNGFTGRAPVGCFFYGDARLQDEGDLLVAERAISDYVDRALIAKKLRREMGDGPAPDLAVGDWFNTPSALSLVELRGKVVLIDFWGTWCSPCVEKMPRTEALHQEFKDRGLVVIGVHSEHNAEGVEEFLKAKEFTFAVGVDTGETAQRYAIEAWPTYFLIDKSGKVAWGFEHDLPSYQQVEELLRQPNP